MARLNTEFSPARNTPDTAGHPIFAKSISLPGPTDAFAAFVRSDQERWAALILEAALKLNP